MRAFKTIRLAGLVLLLLSLVTCSGDFSDGGSPGLRIQALVFPTDIQLTTDSADQSNPAIAYDPVNNKYLIVWEDDRNSNSNATDIYGRLCDATDLNSGNCSGTELAISSTNAMEKEPAVAFDRVNQKYLVVWTDGTNKMIRGRYINSDGSFDGNAFDLITTGTPSQPSLVFNEVTQKFNLAWREENNIFDTNNVINNPPLQGSKCSNTYQLKYIPQPYADNYAVVSGEIAYPSTSITGNTFSGFVWISGPSDNGNDAITASWLVHRQETSPAVFYDPVSGDTYVAWAGKKATISVNVKYSCPSGQNPPCTCNYQETWSESNVDSYQKVYVRKRTTSIVYDLTFSASDSFSPSVAIDPNTRRALLVWEEQTQNNGKDIKGEIIELSNWQAYQAVTVSSAPSDQTRPRVSFDNVNQRYMVVWEDARNGSSDIPNIGIYGQFIDPQGQLSGSNFPVTTYEKNQLLPAIAFGDTDFRYFFIIWKDGRIPGNADIYGNLWQYSVAPQLEITDENNNPLPADTIDFGSVMTGQSVSRVFRIWNKGNSPLTIRGHQDPASPFNIFTTWPTTINPGTYYNMTVTFSPTQKGSFNSTITINSDGGNKTIYLSGNSVEPDIDVSPTSLDFGIVDVGLSKTLSLTISNKGNADLTVSSITTETPFTISESPFTLQPGSSKTITVTFTPQSGDYFTKQLVIISNDPDEGSLTVNLTGTGNAVVTITTTSLRAGTVDGSYSETLKAEGGRKPYTWSIAEGSLPRGLDLAPQTGVISGKPTEIGTYYFTVKVTDANGSVATKGLSIMVYNPITITTTGLKPWTKDVGGYSETLQASGGDGNYTWSIVSGNLPNGLSLRGNQITGTPTLAGDYTFTLRVTDGTGAYQEKEYTIRINAPLQITTDSLPNGTKGVAYSLGINYTGGTAPYTWNATGLPDGLVIDGVTGVISGVPTQAGQSTVTITLQDATGAQVQKSYTLNIYEPVTIMTTSLRAGIVDSSYSETLRAEGGRKPYTWSIAEGSLPRGLDLAPQTGVISGKPTAIGTYNFTVKVTDANGSVATKGLSIMVYNPITITTTGLKPWTKDVGGYSETLQASGGDGNYTWSIVSGNLPNGLSLRGNQITGTPTLAGDYTFTLRVTDGTGAYQEKEYTIRINAPLQITTDSLPNGTKGVAYSLGINYTGGTAPYTWNATGLPDGLVIDGVTGVISGVPTQAGQSTVTITLQDATGAQVQKSYTLKIYNPPDIDISPDTFSFGDVGIGVSKDIVVTMKNIGEAPLIVNTLQLNGSGFVLLNAPQTPFTLNQNASQIFTIRFQPSANVNYSGILTITSNDPDEGNLTYTLTGSGVNPPDIDVTPSLVDFGTVVAGQPKDIPVTIINNITNGADLVISNITVSGNGYTLPTPPSYPITLSAGNTYPITIRFTPPTSGQFSGSLTISSNDPDEGSFKVDLKGNGSVPPDISVSQASLDFGDVLLYQSKTLTLTISNSGGSDLQITNIQITGADFSFKTQPQVPVTIQPGGNPVSIEVLFIPLNAQNYTGQITITSNDPDSPTTIQLTGRGISAPNIEVTPASLDFGKVQINTTSDKTVTIRNTGTEVLNISITISGSQAFTIVPQSFTQVPAGEARNVTVRFSPTGELPYAENLIISSNDPDTPSIQVSLTGEGTSQAGPGGGGGGENISSKGGGCSIGGAMNKPSQVANMVVLLLPLIFVGLRRFVKGIGGK
jgi:hypothetical protein